MSTAVGYAVTSIVSAAVCLALWSQGVTESWLGSVAGLSAGFGATALYLGIPSLRARAARRSTRRAEERERAKAA